MSTSKPHTIDQFFDKVGWNVHENFTCILNLANVISNNNKFYVMQVLNKEDNYIFYIRYGRVGENGKSIEKSMSKEECESRFCKTFRSKTNNTFGEPFIDCKNKYILMDLETPEIIEEESESEDAEELDERISDLISVLGDKKLMAKTMEVFGVDTAKLPLGKISENQIKKGHVILRSISNFVKMDAESVKEFTNENVEQYKLDELTELSSKFWTNIPYACGRNKPPIIQTEEQVAKYADLLEVLENIKIAGKITKKRNSNPSAIYGSIGTEIEPIDDFDSDEWKLLDKYVTNTQGSTHNYLNLKLEAAYRLYKPEEGDVNDFDNIPDHRLLIHGSRTANFIGILSEGLRIPSPSQVNNGSVFGRGIYFADCITKSFNYCDVSEGQGSSNVGYLVLCDVALGDNPDVVTKATFDNRISDQYTSRIALGSMSSDSNDDEIFEGGLKVPCGKLNQAYKDGKPILGGGWNGVLYNEYIIFEKYRYRFEYLLTVRNIK
ncbi:WGR domain-containing protein [bacterium]|nr:WGR domain-containing protein [bacterium]